MKLLLQVHRVCNFAECARYNLIRCLFTPAQIVNAIIIQYLCYPRNPRG